ncbi:ABC transporter ATP-binding protein [Corynebacterium crudilactis]|uniref:Multidrug ABC transporter ATP-binding protein n=1 Tax=Corynebacterium crudilactis TaxID=1652495 RepID=A0A172QUJ6_9CORY|nr:ABC transporter ATP-binding protein [Corynebacterium crudilactis]ANE04320.1 multidrug ABC transporter ATP-binding protein [Corynebacterium crudilactis]
MSPILRVRDLVKRYGDTTAVDRLSFDVAQGEIFAFLGENGAGKTTTISCLIGVAQPTSGDIELQGGQVNSEKLGVVFQQSVLDPLLSAKENLETRGRLYPGVTAVRIDDLIERIGLQSFAHRKYGVLSGGEKRRTDIARALLHDPDILFLDEPTAGLDPRSRHQVWETINALRRDIGLTVFLTTHYMEETELSDSVLIIDRGKEVASGTPLQLRSRYTTTVLTLRSNKPEELSRKLQDLDPIIEGDRIHITLNNGLEAARLAAELDGVLDVEIRHGSMDDVFLAVTAEREQS